MKEFDYTIQDELGIHARPAGLLVKLVTEFESEIIIKKEDQSINLTRLFALMGMKIRHGDTITITCTGIDEEQAVAAVKHFLETEL